MKSLTTIILSLISLSIVSAQTEYSSPVISIGVIVSDLDKSVDFYQNILGMKKSREFDINTDFGIRSGLTGGVPFSVLVFKLEDIQEATEWKLISFGKDAQHPRQKWIQDDTGIQYVTLNVKSLKPFLERFEKGGIPLLGETPTAINDDLWFILVQDPDGNFIELIGPPLNMN